MVLFTIHCPTCQKLHMWFSGNTDQRCAECQAAPIVDTTICAAKDYEYTMTNGEIANAIVIAHSYMGATKETEWRHQRWRDHLDKLLSEQARRATQIYVSPQPTKGAEQT